MGSKVMVQDQNRYPSAFRAPTFSLQFPNANWGHYDLNNNQYAQRFQAMLDLSLDLNKMNELELTEFNGDVYLGIMSALFHAFSKQGIRFVNYQEFLQIAAESNQTSVTITEEMFQQGLFFDNEGNRLLTLDSALQLDPRSYLLNVPAYNLLPEEMRKHFGADLLLIPSRTNPTTATVTLVPHNAANTDWDKHYQFFRALAEQEIPGCFKVIGDKSLFNGFLGIFDWSGLYGGLVPQDEPMPKWKQNTNYGILHKKNKSSDIIEKLLVQNLDDVVVHKNEMIQEYATIQYRNMINELAHSNNLYWGTLGERLGQVMDFLSPKQSSLLRLGIMNYLMKNILSASVQRIEGIEHVAKYMDGAYFEMLPEVAGKLRLYLDLLTEKSYPNPWTFIDNLVKVQDGLGFLNERVYSIHDTVSDKLAQRTGNPAKRNYPKSSDRKDLAPLQEEYLNRLIEVLQEKIPAFDVNREIVADIMGYGETLLILSGASSYIESFENPMAAVALVGFFEANLGRPLVELRERVANRYATKGVRMSNIGQLISTQDKQYLLKGEVDYSQPNRNARAPYGFLIDEISYLQERVAFAGKMLEFDEKTLQHYHSIFLGGEDENFYVAYATSLQKSIDYIEDKFKELPALNLLRSELYYVCYRLEVGTKKPRSEVIEPLDIRLNQSALHESSDMFEQLDVDRKKNFLWSFMGMIDKNPGRAHGLAKGYLHAAEVLKDHVDLTAYNVLRDAGNCVAWRIHNNKLN